MGRALGTVIVAGWLLVGLWGWLELGPTWFGAMRPAPDRINDFYQDWASARNYHEGWPIYSPHSWSVPHYLGLESNPIESIEYNAHPPTAVLLALPVGKLSYPDATLRWNILSLTGFALGFWIVAVQMALPGRALVPLVALLVFCHPVYGNIYQGQLTLILVMLVAAAWAQDRNGRTGAAGCLIGFAAAVKLFPAYLALYYGARLRIRPLLAVVGSFFAICTFTAIVLGADAFVDYFGRVLPYQDKFRSFAYNLSLAGFWYKLFDPSAETGRVQALWQCPLLAKGATLISDFVVTAIIVNRVRQAQTPEARDTAFALVVTGMLLVSPVTWDFSLPLLMIPIAVIVRGDIHSPVRLIALFGIVLAMSVPQESLMALVGHPRGIASPAYMLAVPSVKFYALIALLTLLLSGGKPVCAPAIPKAASVDGGSSSLPEASLGSC